MKVKPTVIPKLMAPEVFKELRRYIVRMMDEYKDRPIDDPIFSRHTKHNDPELVKLHKHLEINLEKFLKTKIKKSYCLVSMYRDEGVCPRHLDRPQCEYTLDLCVVQSQPWTIYVDDDAYILEEGQALLYNGTKSPHFRHKLQPGHFCTMIFFHFVDEDFKGSLD